ncbi:MAG: methyltransferase domain-containing protein [Chloroflexota bacterium]
MNHIDHVNLLRGGITNPGGVWADLGSGSGAFTMALAELIGTTGEIYSVDQDGGALGQQKREMQTRFPKVVVHYQQADFTKRLNLPALDGLVMANSLHFQRQKEPILKLVQDYLKPGGRLLLVEYNVDQGNTWVPYPLSYPTWEKLAGCAGFKDTRLLADRPSRFLHSIYSAASVK